MSGPIQMNESEFSGKAIMCSGVAQNLLAERPDTPSPRSDSVAMRAFMEKLHALGEVIEAYKRVLHSDVTALESTKQTLVDADNAASKSF